MIANVAALNMSANAPDQSIVGECLAGNRIAQKRLYESYCGAMYTVAYRITKNHELANDCLQEAFISVFQNLDSYNSTGTLGSWIKRIVVRKATRHVVYEQRYVDMANLKVEPSVNYQEFSSHVLEQAIQNLPDGARTIFTLIEVEGYKHTETADLLKISVGTSRSQLHYAKKLLKSALKNERNG